MNAQTMPAVASSQRSTATLTAGLLLVLSLFVTAAAAQQYAPPGYAPPPPAYAPPPAYVPAPPPAPPAYAPQPGYAPAPATAPPAYAPQPGYAPAPATAPPAYAPQPGYAPAPGYGAAPAYAPPPASAPPPAYAPAPGYTAPPPAYAAPQGYAPSGAYGAPPTFTAPPVAPTANANAAAGSGEASDFVRRITQSTRFDRSSVARWRAPLCFSVEGLPENENAFVVQRLTQIASGAGARIQTERCRKGSYNFHVLFTLDANRAAKHWYAYHRDLFEENAGSQAQIDRFVDPSTPAPVRVWHSATLFGTDGEPVIPVDPGDPVESLPPQEYTGSRVPPPGVIGLNFAVVIVDGTRTNGAGLAALADYVAMAGLAELDLGADLRSDPTILRLFTAPADARPPGLTAWDQAFLGALYHSADSPKNLRTQLAATVAHEVSASPY